MGLELAARIVRDVTPATVVFAIVQPLSLWTQFRGGSYHSDWFYYFALYGFGALALWWIYRNSIAAAFDAAPVVRIASLIAVLVVAALGLAINNAQPIPIEVRNEHALSFFFDFDWRFVLVKLADIAFQQICLAVLVVVLLDAGLSLMRASMALFIGFVAAHSFLIVFQGSTAILHFAGASLLALAAPWLMARSPFRLYGTFALHFSGYLVGRVIAGYWYG